jgi:hypothetical protein
MSAKIFIFVLVLIAVLRPAYSIWSIQQAQDWQQEKGWLAGCNFIVSTAVNTLEMWQEETWDPVTINTELGYAEDLGFNIVRIFLHYLVWEADPVGLKSRMNDTLAMANSHGIGVMWVLFDDCWAPTAALGLQPLPFPGIHNSQWVQCPGLYGYSNTSMFPLFVNYTVDLLTTFGNDSRVYLWDLYNEPGNSGYENGTLPLLQTIFQAARSVPIQTPVTSCFWNGSPGFATLNDFVFSNSDIITFHNYGVLSNLQQTVEMINGTVFPRPILCSEYMARLMDCVFWNNMPYMKSVGIGAINWGLVHGKTNTVFPWWSQAYSPVPEIWFHDIVYSDGTPFNASEVAGIQQLTANKSLPTQMYYL